MVKRGIWKRCISVLAIAFSLCWQVQCSKRSETKAERMDDGEIEKLLAAGDPDLRTHMDSVPRKEYPFVRKYVKSSNSDVRNLTGELLEHVNQPWVFPYYMVLLRDPVSTIVGLAAEGIFLLSPKEHKEEVIREVERISSINDSDNYKMLAYNLILALGNVCDKGDVDKILSLAKRESSPELKTQYQKALAKIGYQKSLREIDFELTHANGYGKVEAMKKLEYINDPSWVPKVAHLLLDEEAGANAPMGPITIYWRVCDKAIDLLRKLDPQKRITFPEYSASAYKQELVKQARQAYGLTTK
jgi:hypothetical protein